MKYTISLCLCILFLFLGCVEERELSNVWDTLPSSQQLLITSPSDGVSLPLDTSYCSIEWYYRGSTSGFKAFDLYLLKADTVVSYIDSVTFLNGNNIRWEPSEHFAGESDLYRILMRDRNDSTIIDTSDYFSIISPYSGSYSITTKLVNTTYSDYLAIDWVTNGEPGSFVDISLYKDSVFLFTIIDTLRDTSGYRWHSPERQVIEDTTYQIRVTSTLDNTISSSSEAFTLSGQVVNDSFELDNSINSAKNISVGESQDRSSYRGDRDWVSMTLEKGKHYRLTATDCDVLALRLYYNNSSEIIEVDSSIRGQEILYSPTKTGTYSAVIYRYWVSSNNTFRSAYTLSLSEYDPKQALLITKPILGDTVTAGITTSLSWDELLSIGSYVRIDLFQDSSHLYTISERVYGNNSGSWLAPAWIESGIYSIKISDAAKDTLYGFSDSFYIAGIENDHFEPNNTEETATPLVIDSVSEHILTVSDTDCFTIPVVAGNTYAFTLNTVERVVVSLFDGSDEVLLRDTLTTGTTFRHRATKNETLLLVVDAGEGEYYQYYGGNYSLTVSKAETDSLVKFTFPITSSTVDILSDETIQWDAPVLGERVTIQLYNGEEVAFAITSGVINSGTFQWSVANGLETGDDYRIKLSIYGDTSSYGFSQPFTINGLVADKFEIDQPLDLANRDISFGVRDTHTLLFNDTDWIKIHIESNFYYTTTITSDFPCYATLYEPTPQKFAGSWNIDSTTDSKSYTSDLHDSLLIAVTGKRSYNGGTYDIEINKTSKDSLISVTYPDPSAIFAAGDLYDVRWNAFALEANLFISLYKGETDLGTIKHTANSGACTWRVNGGHTTGSDYRIKITQSGDSTVYAYSDYFTISGIQTDAYEPDNERTNAGTISINPPVVQERTISFNDTDWVQISMIKDSLYAIGIEESSAGNSSISLALFDDLSEEPLAIQKGTQNLWLCERSGTYYAKLWMRNSSASYYGGYTLTVEERGSTKYSVAVTVPGDTLTNNATITWTNGQYIGDAVDIFLYKDGVIATTIKSNVRTIGSYEWIIPSTVILGDGYSIKVVSRWKSALQGESATFTIQ